VNRRVFTGVSWETAQPFELLDRKVGALRMNGSGVFAIRIADPRQLVGGMTQPTPRNTAQLVGRLRETIVHRVTRVLQDRLTRLTDLPGLYNDLATEVRLELKEDFSAWGIDLIDFFITAVTPTEEAARILGTQPPASGPRTSPAAPGLLRPDDPTRGGRALGLGVGGGMGLILPEAFGGSLPASERGADPCPRCGRGLPAGPACRACSGALPAGARFCPHCGAESPKTSRG
jgi:membrane protease subunit (stomatin/prohibitin family)